MHKCCTPEQLADMRKQAQAAADESGTTISLVHAPIENAEEYEFGRSHYGYCPAIVRTKLFRNGELIENIMPS